MWQPLIPQHPPCQRPWQRPTFPNPAVLSHLSFSDVWRAHKPRTSQLCVVPVHRRVSDVYRWVGGLRSVAGTASRSLPTRAHRDSTSRASSSSHLSALSSHVIACKGLLKSTPGQRARCFSLSRRSASSRAKAKLAVQQVCCVASIVLFRGSHYLFSGASLPASDFMLALIAR